jgi:hypothetical protein
VRKLFAAFLVAVILLGGNLIWRVWAQGPNTFCASNTACTVTALWNFTTGNLTYNGVAPAVLPINLAGGAGVVTGVLPGANMAATNLAGGNNPGGVSGTLPNANLTTQGTDANLLTSGTVSASTGVALCTDANHGATTSGCPGGASGFKIECTSVTPVTAANTVTKTALIASCTIPANDIGASQWFYVDAFGILGDTAAPSLTIELDLDAVIICSWSPSLATANNQPWAIHGWFNGITTGASGSVSGCSIQWMSSASGGGGSAGNLALVADDTTGVAAPPQTVTVDTTVSHVLALKVTWGVANSLNTITQNNLIVERLN